MCIYYTDIDIDGDIDYTDINGHLLEVKGTLLLFSFISSVFGIEKHDFWNAAIKWRPNTNHHSTYGFFMKRRHTIVLTGWLAYVLKDTQQVDSKKRNNTILTYIKMLIKKTLMCCHMQKQKSEKHKTFHSHIISQPS